jgi:hypothetical protein
MEIIKSVRKQEKATNFVRDRWRSAIRLSCKFCRTLFYGCTRDIYTNDVIYDPTGVV